MAFSSDGSWLATASSDQMVKVWKTATGLQFSTLHAHSNNVRALAFSPDGRTLAGGGEDGTIEFWDVATFRELISLEAHSGGVKFLAFSDDGHTLASSGQQPRVAAKSSSGGIRGAGIQRDVSHRGAPVCRRSLAENAITPV